MHIEIRDQTPVEGLNKLSPRPNSTYDDVIKMLLEQQCKLKAAEIAQKVVERLLNVLPIQAGQLGLDEKGLRAVVEEAVAKVIESKDVEGPRDVVNDAKMAPVNANAIELISEKAAAKAVRMAFKSGSFRNMLNRIIGNAMAELVEQTKDILAEQIKWTLVERILAEQVKEALAAHMPEILRAAEDVRRGGWEVVIQQALKRPDRCLTFGEIKRLYKRDLNSEMLRSHGFVRKEKGIWCYVGEQKGES